jgi:hypothetical protein
VVTASGGIGTFGFNARNLGAALAIGHFNWVDHHTGCHVNGPVTQLTVCGIKATFSGTCGPATACTSFTVSVTDNGEPGKNDTISVTVIGTCQGTPPPTEQKLLRGNIQVHK